MSVFKNKVLKLVLQAGESYGLALGGGHALSAHNVVSRETKDIDGFVNSLNAETYDGIEKAVAAALDASNIHTEIIERNDFLRVIKAIDKNSGEAVIIDLNYGHRDYPAVSIEKIGLVLDLTDVVTGKLIAFCERKEARDYIDIAAVLNNENFSLGSLIEVLSKVRPEIQALDFIARLSDVASCKKRLIDDYGLALCEYNNLVDRINESIENYVKGKHEGC